MQAHEAALPAALEHVRHVVGACAPALLGLAVPLHAYTYAAPRLAPAAAAHVQLEPEAMQLQ